MKRFIFVILLIFMMFSLPSCKSKKFDPTDYDNLYVQIVFKSGDKINLELYHDIAPITVEHFIEVAMTNHYENTIFHRVIKDFMIQGGGYTLDGNKITQIEKVSSIKGEFSINGFENTLKHTVGVISMARTNDPDSATDQFFICSADCSRLDGSYAAFGKCSDQASIDVVLKFSNEPTYYVSSMFSDFPENPMVIKTINLANEAFK